MGKKLLRRNVRREMPQHVYKCTQFYQNDNQYLHICQFPDYALRTSVTFLIMLCIFCIAEIPTWMR